MRKLVARAKRPDSEPAQQRVYRVNLERFAHFGDAGTPPGMISSKSAVSVVVSGSCGGRPPSQPSPGTASIVALGSPAELGAQGWGPPPAALQEGGDTDGVPVARVGVLEWSATQVYNAAAPEPIDDEPPTAKLSLPSTDGAAPIPARVREPSAEQPCGEPERDEVAREVEPASRRKWLFVGVGVPLLGLALGLFWLAGQREGERVVDIDELAAPAPAPASDPPPLARVVEPENSDTLELVEELPVEEVEVEAVPTAPPDRPRKVLAHETKPCLLTREQAAQASTAGDWKQVITLTEKGKCWSRSDKVELKLARMGAQFELGRPVECVKVGQGSNHPKIVTLRKRCTLAQK